MADLLDLRTAAVRLGVTPGRVRQLVSEGRLQTSRLGGVHVLTEQELERYTKGRRGAGRPRTSSTKSDGREWGETHG
jgi:excisionase family DNA binding protein